MANTRGQKRMRDFLINEEGSFENNENNENAEHSANDAGNI